jgi:serine/threonine-protein kinase
MSIRTSIGPYQLVRVLGRGGMAEVHLAIAHGASGFQRRVAIKTLAPELADDAELTRALIHEASLAGALHHRNLVAVLGLGVDDGVYYVVMEHVDGGDLATLAGAFDNAVLPEPLAARRARARDRARVSPRRDDRGLPLGIVHRDVSTAKSTAGDVKLADFGVALGPSGPRRHAQGKYVHVSRALASEPLAQSSDQFGLAVTLVELSPGIARSTATRRGRRWTRSATARRSCRACPRTSPRSCDARWRSTRGIGFDRSTRSSTRSGTRRSREPVGSRELGAWV